MRKKKLEFMQKLLIYLGAFATLCTLASFALSYFDKNPVEQLSIEIVRLAWGGEGVGIIGYVIQNCYRAKWFGDKTANDK